MCGLTGIISRGRHSGDIRAMTALLQHRGPDDDGFFEDDWVRLGFRRLAIIDLVTGAQPVFNEDRTVLAALNGEIYNYRELREVLRSRGHHLSSEGDTETLVHLYEDHGIDFVHRLNGMFAFVLYDRARRRVYLVRDRLGVKPLYYARQGGTVAFASEIKAILQCGLAAPQFDLEMLRHYLSYMYVPGPRTIFRGVTKLPPGHYLEIADGEARTVRYWDVQESEAEASEPGAQEERLLALLDDAVRLQLRSDVPLGVLLSGGLDSGMVVALASRHLDRPLETFTVSFEGGYDERPLARSVAERYGTHHHEFHLTYGPVSEHLVRLAWYMDEPVADSGLLPNYLISQIARQHVKVVLAGTGGDELFAGYERYALLERERWYLRLPSGLRSGIVEPLVRRVDPVLAGKLSRTSHWGTDRIAYHLGKLAIFPETDVAALAGTGNGDLQAAHRAYAGRFHDDLNRRLYMDAKTYLVDDLLVLLDRMTMAWSLEGRVPILDHRFVEFMFAIPGRGKPGKAIIRALARRFLPAPLFDAPKTGFASPVGFWMAHGLGQAARWLLLERHGGKHPWWKAEVLRGMLDPRRTHANAQRVYALAMLELVHLMHVERTFTAPPSVSLADLMA